MIRLKPKASAQAGNSHTRHFVAPHVASALLREFREPLSDGEIMFVGAVFLQRHSGSPGGAVMLCVDEQSVHSLTPMNLGAQASEELIGYVAGSCGDESACFNWLVVGSYGVVVDARLLRDAHQPADRGRVPVARGREPLLLCLHGGARSIGKLALP
jgi:hypothetical protein